MTSPLNAQLARLADSEVGTMEGAAGVVVMRVETQPLADDTSDGKPRVSVLILNRIQADRLRKQLTAAIAKSDPDKPS